jgi:hypothetical protein
MNKLKQNAFWAGLGIAGVALVAFFGLMVVPATMAKATAHSRIVKLKNTLRDKGAFAGDEDIKSFEEARAKYKDNYSKIGEFYSKSKEHLERWFPALNLPSNQDPARDAFTGIYHNESATIEEALRKKGVAVGIGSEDANDKKPRFGFSWEDPTPDDWGKIMQAGDEKKVVREIQKRFWARQRVANAILTIVNDGGKVNRVHDFRFFKRLHTLIQNPAWEIMPQQENQVVYMGIGMSANQNIGLQSFNEYELPQKLGRTMTFGFALELPYSQVPRIISEMLNPAAEKDVAARLLVNVIGTNITIRDQNMPEVLIRYGYGDQADKDRKTKEAQENVKPIDVLVTVTCQLIDFEPSELKKFDGSDAAPKEK